MKVVPQGPVIASMEPGLQATGMGLMLSTSLVFLSPIAVLSEHEPEKALSTLGFDTHTKKRKGFQLQINAIEEKNDTFK